MNTGAALTRADALRLPLASDSVDLIVTSPPYFALRSYRDEGEHYGGQVGSEDTPQAFLEALWAATAEMARVLKPSGSIFVNLGDRYAGSGGHNNSNIGSPGDRGPSRYNQSSYVQPYGSGGKAKGEQQDMNVRVAPAAAGVPAKSLMLLPERYRIGCVDRLGLIARAVVVWSKPNGLPESVTDRVRRSHEDWVHLTKASRYFAAMDEVREEYAPASLESYARGGLATSVGDGTHPSKAGGSQRRDGNEESWRGNPLGKLPGSVWSIPSEPLRVPDHLGVSHFAAFPQEWPRRLILGWSPSGVCVECGEGRRPVVESSHYDPDRPQYRRALELAKQRGLTDEHLRAIRAVGVIDTEAGAVRSGGRYTSDSGKLAAEAKEQLGGYYRELCGSGAATIVGYACACTPYTDHAGSGESSGPSYADAVEAGRYVGRLGANDGGRVREDARPKTGPRREYHLDGWTPPPTRPAVVLDPFVGTGTVPMVARALGRFGVGVDLSADYLRLAGWRIWESGHASKARERTNREAQADLFGAA